MDLIPAGYYKVKVTNAEIKVSKADKKYIMLTLEVQDEGPYKSRRLWMNVSPWNDFNWMSGIKAFFTDDEIEMYMLEKRDNKWFDVLGVVTSLIIGNTAKAKVGESHHNGRDYNYVMRFREASVVE